MSKLYVITTLFLLCLLGAIYFLWIISCDSSEEDKGATLMSQFRQKGKGRLQKNKKKHDKLGFLAEFCPTPPPSKFGSRYRWFWSNS